MIQWGIIGCGDVTETKSGPAFKKVEGSALVAVMRRNEGKVADYARRHDVSRWYTDAEELFNDERVNAIYVATPPSSHYEYCIQAIEKGLPVYVEKPMAMNAAEAYKIAAAAKANNVKISVAHYRRLQPKFLQIKSLLPDLGKINTVQLFFNREIIKAEDMENESKQWRIDPAISGGGLFHDLAPHQLDLLLYYFGEAETVSGKTAISQEIYKAADYVSASLDFKNGIHFSGEWNFNSNPEEVKDEVKIDGENGQIIFSVFDNNTVSFTKNNQTQKFDFPELEHVQLPMIAEVVRYFNGSSPNPCSAEDGVTVMQWIDEICT